MADDSERMRQLQERLAALQRELETPEPRPAPELDLESSSPVQPGRGGPGRARAVINLVLLIVAIVVGIQLAFTLAAFNGHDFKDARRLGTATVQSCERRGPIGLSYGYWNECSVSIQWNDGTKEYRKVSKPHLFEADEVGKSVEVGDNGTTKSGRSISRPTLPPRPLLAVLGLIFGIVAGIPALILLFGFWHLVKDAIGSAFRRR